MREPYNLRPRPARRDNLGIKQKPKNLDKENVKRVSNPDDLADHLASALDLDTSKSSKATKTSKKWDTTRNPSTKKAKGNQRKALKPGLQAVEEEPESIPF